MFDYLIATDASVDNGEEEDEEGEGKDGAGAVEVESNHDDDKNEDDEEEEEEDSVDGSKSSSDDADSDEDEHAKNPHNSSRPLQGTSNAKKSKGNNASKTAIARSDSTTQSASVSAGYGVSRGIDFQGVNFVVNFDFPRSVAAYTHRVGRTARGGATGTALSFVRLPPSSGTGSHDTHSKTVVAEEERAAAELDAEVLAEVRHTQPRLSSDSAHAPSATPAGSAAAVSAAAAAAAAAGGVGAGHGTDVNGGAGDDEHLKQPAALQFNMQELEAFRYRVEDTLRAVTPAAVKELRAAELRREVLNSQKLKTFFAENPTDLKVRMVD